MSVQEAIAPTCSGREGPIELMIDPQPKDLGEFVVRRALPAPQRQRVGPFIFFDHIGPADFNPGSGVNVRAHPHIGIATITYLFAGQIMHRDSLGYAQVIEKGAINWMTAGRGIVHSERTPEDLKNTGSQLDGIPRPRQKSEWHRSRPSVTLCQYFLNNAFPYTSIIIELETPYVFPITEINNSTTGDHHDY